MKKNKIYLLLFSIFMSVEISSQATLFNVGFDTRVNNGKLFVDLYISFDVIDNLGNSNFQFSYSNEGIANPQLDSENLVGSYNVSLTSPLTNILSFNADLQAGASGDLVPATPDPLDGLLIGTIQFDISDFDMAPDFNWRVSNDGTQSIVITEGFNLLSFGTIQNSNNTLLPITLSSFTAEKSGDRNALLNWTSSQEINASHFTVQRSGDGYEFEDIGRIEAAGNSSSPIDYNYLDRNINIQRNTSKLIYYRLKQVDIDGFTEFSEIRALRFDRIGLAEVSVYPNPTADVLHLDISEDVLDSQINYEIFDVQGKMVVNQQINIDHQKLHLLNLRASGLQSGIYFIKLRNQKELLSSHKFVLISQ